MDAGRSQSVRILLGAAGAASTVGGAADVAVGAAPAATSSTGVESVKGEGSKFYFTLPAAE